MGEDRLPVRLCYFITETGTIVELHNYKLGISMLFCFVGRKIFTGNILRIKYMHRSEAGVYRCLAHNYVPGSRLAFAEARVSVLYPPSDLAIKKLQGGKLSCETRGGSIPPPLYSWIYPNRKWLFSNNLEDLHKNVSTVFVLWQFNRWWKNCKSKKAYN